MFVEIIRDMDKRMSRLFYRLFRALKSYCIAHRPPGITWLFFGLLPHLETLFSARREGPLVELDRAISKRIYFTRYSRLAPPFFLRSEVPLAKDSSDHLWPHGTLHDNSKNPKFNLKLYALLGYKPDISVLDLGCSGGAFVRSVLDDGYFAVGLEGSDVSLKLQGGEWGSIPLHLHTCDITKRFSIENPAGEDLLFDTITAWEVLEHIPEPMLDGLIENISRNLKSGGHFIASVATFLDSNPITGAIYHVTLQPKNWWTARFANHGFTEVSKHNFTHEDWVRGAGRGLTDWHPEDGFGFHLVLQKTA